ncbi:MAG: MBOAT family O-acyltransferase [Saccharofermentanales bacterium]|jgi:alginate O-acetyltransferase complex protein AlgI
MVFSSLFFLYIFLPLCLVLVWFSRRVRTQNNILLAFSLVFYAWGEPVYVLLLIITTFVIWYSSIMMSQTRSRKQRKFWLMIAVVIALAGLAFFKYAGFFVELLNYLPLINFKVPQISLPIGISFYTFQALTYVIDYYRGEIPVQKSYRRFLLYVTLFPQLIAGPIVRYSDVARQLSRRYMTLDGVVSGISRFLGGLAKKVLIANYASEIVEVCFESDHFGQVSTATAILGLLAYTIQIYYDFSGYSDMAIGLGHMFGFHFLENFRYPYIASTITEFWRRWHISLSTFFRDYVYIPLGGNRHHPVRNTFLVWFLTGLWHGASLNFVVWGLYFFILLMFERTFIRNGKLWIPKPLGHLLTMLAVMFSWSIFYFTEPSKFTTFIGRLFAPGLAGFVDGEGGILWRQHIIFIVIAFIGAAPILPWLKRQLRQPLRQIQNSPLGAIVQPMAYITLLVLCTAALAASSYNPFLYYRF